jgi:DNA-binding MarR family transcriptional regulator
VSRRLPKRAELLAALNGQFREFSTAAIMFHQAIADRLGLNITDHKCAGILCGTGPIPAGELAQRTGLTTGAITGVIDRLEKAGFARRVKDPNDRRRVIVEPFPDRIEREVAPLFESMARAMAELCAQYSTKQLAAIRDFIPRACRIAYEEIRKLREGSAPAGRGGKTKTMQQ